jgi:hypothetical protein
MGCEDLFSRGTTKTWGGKILLFWVLFWTAFSMAWGGTDTGADFLKIPASAHAVSLGNAYTAQSMGSESLGKNLAGLGLAPASLSVTHQQLFGDNSFDSFALTHPGRTLGALAWGLSVNRLSYADQEGRAQDRQFSGSFGANDLAVGLALAKNFNAFQIGTQIKMVRQELAGFSATGMAVDLGVMSRTPFERLSMGLAVRNMGPSMKFISEEYHLPLSVSAGVSFQVMKPLILVFDIQNNPYQRETSAAFGFEFSAVQNLSLRAGYLNKITQAVTNRQTSETNRGNVLGIGGLTGGLGFRIDRIRLDYAISPFGELGTNHVFTISTAFGGGRHEEQPKTVDEKPAEERSIAVFPPVENNFGVTGSGSTLPE